MRRPRFDFDSVPRHWNGGNAIATHYHNGINLLIPEGERFLIRTIKRYLEHIDDPELLREARAFIGQEGAHAREHMRACERLVAQGYRTRGFMRIFDVVAVRGLERFLPGKVLLAAAAAIEHFTAAISDDMLSHDRFRHAHPVMRTLFEWHCSEEIEHKAVAFDVLQAVTASYPIRCAGLFVAASTLVGFWLAAMALLLHEDRLTWAQLKQAKDELEQLQAIDHKLFRRAVRQYLARSFHPWNHDNSALSRRHVQRRSDD